MYIEIGRERDKKRKRERDIKRAREGVLEPKIGIHTSSPLWIFAFSYRNPALHIWMPITPNYFERKILIVERPWSIKGKPQRAYS